MATVKQPSKYGVVELNKVAAVKTGQVKAQFPLDATDFASIPAENGMLLFVDEVGEKVELPASANAYVYLHASVEKDYEGKGRKNFAVMKDNDFYPRLFTLATGDTFETNCFQYDDTVYANYAAITAAISVNTVYGVPSTAGYIQILAAPAGSERVILKAVKGVTLPNGESGLKFAVERARNFDDSIGAS